MSIKLMTKAWEMDIPTGQKMVLLALCDHANDDGTCYPSQNLISDKCSMSERSVINHVNWLKARGFLASERRQKGGSRLSNLYVIDVKKLQKSQHENSAHADSAHADSAHADISPTNMKKTTDQGENFSGSFKEEPSMNHQIEPSDIKRETKAAAENAQPKPSAKRGSNYADQMRMLTDRGVDEQVAADYLQIRAAKRSPLTQTALAGIEREAAKAKLTLTQALVACTERGWLIAKDEWLRRDVVSAGKANSKPSVKDIPKHTKGGAFPATEIW